MCEVVFKAASQTALNEVLGYTLSLALLYTSLFQLMLKPHQIFIEYSTGVWLQLSSLTAGAYVII